jgi:hypothetical protein
MNGELAISLAPSAAGSTFAALGATCSYDLTGEGVSVAIVAAPTGGTGVETALVVEQPATGAQVSWRILNSVLRSQLDDANGLTTYAQIPFDAVMTRVLRIREESTRLLFETSPDGATWSQQSNETPAFDLTSVRIELVAGTSMPVASPGTAIFDDVQIVP